MCLPCENIAILQTEDKKKSHGGEREADGAYSPRDKHHGHGEEHDSGMRLFFLFLRWWISNTSHPLTAFDHEAIIGSKKEAEQFDDLSPEEAKKRLRILLTKMDRDNDEAVDK